MKSNLLNITGVQVLSKENQRQVYGQVFVEQPIDLSLCGCSCSGSVTGPDYCSLHFGCLQVYRCDDNKV